MTYRISDIVAAIQTDFEVEHQSGRYGERQDGFKKIRTLFPGLTHDQYIKALDASLDQAARFSGVTACKASEVMNRLIEENPDASCEEIEELFIAKIEDDRASAVRH
jgi:hypothetical protein